MVQDAYALIERHPDYIFVEGGLDLGSCLIYRRGDGGVAFAAGDNHVELSDLPYLDDDDVASWFMRFRAAAA